MNKTTIEDYLVNYIPGLIGRFLTEDPVPCMEGTVFTLQITFEGEKSLAFGITIQDAKKITVTPGGLKNPHIALQIPEHALRPVVKLVSLLTGREQYDLIEKTKGSMELEINLAGGHDVPVRIVFNGTEEPHFKMAGSSPDLAKIASGTVDPAQAFMQGMIRLYGDLTFALWLAQLAPKKRRETG